MKAYRCDDFEGELKSSEETIPEWVNLVDLHTLELLPNVGKVIEEARQF
jgi:hypothetical protein